MELLVDVANLSPWRRWPQLRPVAFSSTPNIVGFFGGRGGGSVPATCTSISDFCAPPQTSISCHRHLLRNREANCFFLVALRPTRSILADIDLMLAQQSILRALLGRLFLKKILLIQRLTSRCFQFVVCFSVLSESLGTQVALNVKDGMVDTTGIFVHFYNFFSVCGHTVRCVAPMRMLWSFSFQDVRR